MRPLRPPLALLTALVAGCAAAPNASGAASVARPPAPEAAPAQPAPINLNSAILASLPAYNAEGHRPYAWSRGVNTDGVTHPIWWKGTLLAAPEADGGIHCSGITFEVYLQALETAVGEDQGPSAQTLLALKSTWYVRDGTDQGPVGALVGAGLGDPVGWRDLQPGDLVQFWRNNGKGHSVVFIRHTRNTDGSIHGMVYWSAQGTSGGIGMRRTSPGSTIDQINPARVWGVRARWPARPQTATR